VPTTVLSVEDSTVTTTFTTGHTGSQTSYVGMPPFLNQNFDVEVFPATVNVNQTGGSFSVQVQLKPKNISSSEALAFTTNSSITGYSVSFSPNTLTLNPSGVANVELKVTIPGGLQDGVYAMSIVASGQGIRGGTWLVINVGSSQVVPPP
jgi:hypothetical protein